MTDKDIADFIVHRADINGKQYKLRNPELILYMPNDNTAIVALQYSNNNEPFMLRFTNGTQRGLFKLKYNREVLKPFIKQLMQSAAFGQPTVKYDVDTLPGWTRHIVSCTIIDALKTKGMGVDAFAISHLGDIELIRPNETYEQAAIETDLLALGMPNDIDSLAL